MIIYGVDVGASGAIHGVPIDPLALKKIHGMTVDRNAPRRIHGQEIAPNPQREIHGAKSAILERMPKSGYVEKILPSSWLSGKVARTDEK